MIARYSALYHPQLGATGATRPKRRVGQGVADTMSYKIFTHYVDNTVLVFLSKMGSFSARLR